MGPDALGGEESTIVTSRQRSARWRAPQSPPPLLLPPASTVTGPLEVARITASASAAPACSIICSRSSRTHLRDVVGSRHLGGGEPRDRVGREIREPQIRRLHRDERTVRADTLRFVGSPAVRVRGRDVQPEAEQRTDYGLG